jgi:hypothetical protein
METPVTREYLTGELSVLLEKLLAVTPPSAAGDVTNLRHQVETGPITRLAAEMTLALALADKLCWDSLSRGDAVAFDRQAVICGEIRLFGACARLSDEE